MRLTDTIAAALLVRVPGEVGVGAWHRGDTTVVGVGADEVVVGNGVGALSALDALGAGTWVGWLAFEVGHAIESVATNPARRGASCEPAAVHDAVFARFGSHAMIAPDGSITIDGDGPGRALLHSARRALEHAGRDLPRGDACANPLEWSSSIERAQFESSVDAIVELLRAGECYQVNLTRRLTTPVALDAVALYHRLAVAHPAPYSAMLRLRDPRVGHVAVVSASPERYLRVDGRHVETQPIKGTASDAGSLRASAKDHAENVMIVDLARNDLGRVCRPGTIDVPSLFAIEAHPGLHHLVSTVCGTLRDDVGMGALVAATFPPASVTGAPKPRVLQAIEDLEPVRRGVYCGGFGWIDTEHGCADLAVAIRTFCVYDDRTELGVGAGIVADSSSSAEWAETELKAARLLAAAGASAPARPVRDAVAAAR